eukprot:gene28983-38024_t
MKFVSVLILCECLLPGLSFKFFSSRTVFPSAKLFYSTNNIKYNTLSGSSETVANIILYDGVCNFCNKWVDLLLRFDSKKQFSFSPLQSESGKQLLTRIGKESNDISSVVYIKKLSTDPTTKNEFYFKSDAALKVMEQLGGLSHVASNFFSVVPLSLRDKIYDIVAFNRYNILGKREECRCSDKTSPERFL